MCNDLNIPNNHGEFEQERYLSKIAELEKENKYLQNKIAELCKQLERDVILRLHAEEELNKYRGISVEQDKMML